MPWKPSPDEISLLLLLLLLKEYFRSRGRHHTSIVCRRNLKPISAEFEIGFLSRMGIGILWSVLSFDCKIDSI